MQHLPTYTWNGRNTKAIKSLVEVLNQWNVRDITLIDIGPGGIAERYASYLPEGDQASLPIYRRAQKQFINMLESGARDSAKQNLVCFEVPQILRELESIGIERLLVVDKFKKVLDATEGLDYKMITRTQCDIEQERIQYRGKLAKGKVVVALYVIERCTQNPKYALETISESVEDGGYLLLSLPKEETRVIPGFLQLRKEENGKREYFGIFYKGERIDKKKAAWTGKAPELVPEEVIRRALAQEEGPIRIKL